MNRLHPFAQPLVARRPSHLWMLIGGLALVLLLGGGLLKSTTYAATGASAVVRGGGTDLYSEPDGALLGALSGGTIVSALGRSADQTWIVVQTQDGAAGWLPAAALLTLDTAALPVMSATQTALSAPAAQVPLPTVTPTAMSTPPVTFAADPAATASPAPQPAPSQPVVGIVAAAGADLLDAPGGAVIAHLTPGTLVDVAAASDDRAWLLAQRRDDAAVQGWIATAHLFLADITQVSTLGIGSETAAGADTGTAELPAQPGAVYATVTSGGERLNIRSGPDTTFDVIAKAQDGERYAVLARNATGAWLQIDTGTGYAAQYHANTGWVAAEFVTLEGAVAALPVADTALPTSLPTPLPAATPVPATGTLLQTSNLVAASTPSTVSSGAVDGLSGTLVFQTSPGGTIYAYAPATGDLWPLTNGFDPAISPDGQTVAFVRDGGENGIYLIDIDGSDERLIFSGRARLSSPKWSTDGAWIVFTRSDEYTECYQMGPMCLDGDSLPPGMEIGTSKTPLVRQYQYHLARVDRSGANYRDLATLESARAADWNEAGIVYESDAGLQITTDTPDAENRLVVFDYLKPFYSDPDWQPQGGQIVYMGKEASHWELFSIQPDGSSQTALTRPATTLVDEIPSNVAPAWSPDGQHIVFLSNRADGNTTGAWRLWVMDAGGDNQRPLPIAVTLDYSFGGEQAVSWGP